MPRPNPPRSLTSEANLARRIAAERAARTPPMSYEGLAQRMADAGCPIQASAIYKIEKGNPPRRISVDEFVAFAQVFNIPMADLLLPPEVAALDVVKRGLQRMHEMSQERERLAVERMKITRVIHDKLDSHPKIRDEVLAYVDALSEDDSIEWTLKRYREEASSGEHQEEA